MKASASKEWFESRAPAEDGLEISAGPLVPKTGSGEATLRRLLAFCYCGSQLYADDGELQDNRMRPWIDFKRDTPEEIERKMEERGHKILMSHQNDKLTHGGPTNDQ